MIFWTNSCIPGPPSPRSSNIFIGPFIHKVINPSCLDKTLRPRCLSSVTGDFLLRQSPVQIGESFLSLVTQKTRILPSFHFHLFIQLPGEARGLKIHRRFNCFSHGKSILYSSSRSFGQDHHKAPS